ncbi:amidophosphoribosyltransferase [Wenzhouxiangella sediminis]|uniref:Amidophosphoribosyltransferase n=1 Tax=Wenzhouxiangella sediminis TaxID=1792836 RepID=A0A3E1K7P9_9GAMM|nr:amidophosphoribosyltransferase [Wenzhouxiangella sediminis]RFF30058.1 amidophosphoribosyltransferase [Wenzhouxiangella sediminis]
MCGIVGIVGRSPVAARLYDAMTILQHRGQDAAGITTLDDGRMRSAKGLGLVRDVFSEEAVTGLTGEVGIGHVRYPTAGCDQPDEAQPMYVNSPCGIALGHNGNLINSERLSRELFVEDRRHINTESDSEVLLNVLAHELAGRTRDGLHPEDIFAAVDGVYQRCRGGYAAVALIAGVGLVAFRDPNGIRPAVVGRREAPEGPEYIVASESVVLDILGFELISDIAPGECVFITLDGELHRKVSDHAASYTPCMFEYVYFARPDSMIDDLSVYKARLRMGEALAEKILQEWPDHDIDVVIPVPDTSRTACLPLAHQLGVKYREGLIKNRYIGRTFIMPGQEARVRSVRRKLNAISLEFRNKNVLLVDDSIVRGTTSKQIIQMAREAGAKKVYLASASPPVRYPNVYGIDMPAASELVASGRSEEEICRVIGADRLIYQDLEALEKAVRGKNQRLTGFDSSCFSGEYVTGLDEGYLEELESRRSDAARMQRRRSG